MTTKTTTKTQRIRALNDSLRHTFTGGRLVMTASVQSIPPDTVALALTKMRAFNEFTPDNDPYGEHDFGSFEVAREQIGRYRVPHYRASFSRRVDFSRVNHCPLDRPGCYSPE